MAAITAELRSWLSERSMVIGLGLAAMIGALATLIFIPLGPPVGQYGTVVGFGLSESELGSSPLAVVRLGNSEVTVTLTRSSGCAIGSRIHIWRTRLIWGPTYSARATGCD